MTGANRLLIGIGWTTRRVHRVVPDAAYARTLPEGAGAPAAWSGVALDRTHAVEIAFLAVATLYSLTLPLKSSSR